ncbi:GAF domain-containing protein [Candidatus Woesearchaeota archaeon]|nr:GAF domain-containing protein [Candidatus Woesearchaeota archaeon]
MNKTNIRTDEALLDSRNFLQIINSANDGVYTLDKQGRFTFFNKQAEEITGYKSREVLGRNFIELGLIDQGSLEKTTKEFKERLRGIKGRSYEIALITKRGEKKFIELNTSPLRKTGEVIGILGIGRDISQRKHLEHELHKKVERLSALYDIRKTISSTLDLEVILNLIIVKIVKLTRVTTCEIYLKDNDQNGLKQYSSHFPEGSSSSTGAEMRMRASSYILRVKKPLYIADISKDHRFGEPDRNTTAKISFLGVPLFIHGTVIGTLTISTKKHREFSEGETQLFIALAEEAASTIENAKLYEQIKKDKQNLTTLLDLSQKIGNTLNYEDLLQKMLQKFIEISRATLGTIHLPDKNERFSIKYAYGISKMQILGFDAAVSHGRGLTGTAVREKRILVIPDIVGDRRYYQVSKTTRSEIVIPLLLKNRVIGVLNLESDKPDNFSETSQLLILLVNKIALTLENARLYSQLVKRNKELLALYENGTKLQILTNVRDILAKAINTFKGLGFDRIHIYLYDEERKQLCGAQSSHFPEEIFSKVCLNISRRTTAVRSISEKRPVIIQEKKNDLTTVLDKEGVREYADFPMFSKDLPVGIITVDNKHSKKPLSDWNLDTLMIFANQIAVSLVKAQLYQRTKQFNEILQDEVYRATRELEEKNKRLTELDTLKSDFVSAVSHELRTPLTSIKGYTSLLLMEKVKNPDIVKKCLHIINDETNRLKHLIEDILDLSYLESGKINFNPRPEDPHDIIQKVNNSMIGFALRHKVLLVVDSPLKLPPCSLDKDKIEQVLTNLLSNAIKFSNPNQNVILGAKVTKHVTLFYVKDFGIGMEKKKIPYIFDKFYQIENKTSRKQGGTGLGLAIVKEIVSLHKGFIAVKSVLGKGTTFAVILPKIPEQFTEIVSLLQSGQNTKNLFAFFAGLEKGGWTLVWTCDCEDNKDTLCRHKQGNTFINILAKGIRVIPPPPGWSL